MLTTLLWDVDGTLAETERDGHRLAFNQAFADACLPWRWDVAHYGTLLSTTGGRERLLRDMATRADAPPSLPEREQLANELHRRKNQAYAQIVAQQCVTLRPGVPELIEEAQASGLRQAIVTTTSRINVEALLRQQLGAGWKRRFAACICGEDVKLKKPAPDAYRYVLALLGLAPRQALALEDAPAGVAAAQGAGIPVVVTRSAYFADDPVDAALAVGPGLHDRQGWRPALDVHAGRVTLDDLTLWHSRAQSSTTLH